MTKKIILTGGGTAGHVTPNIALLPGLRERGFEIRYIGSYNGIEKKLIENEGIPYDGIASGKLRRSFDMKNVTDVKNVVKGLHEARKLLKNYQPDIVFSKGGYVSVPVVAAAHELKIPVIIHESDLTPGLANKLCFHSASKICCNFPETLHYLPKNKAVLSGSPIRSELLSGSREAGLSFTGLSGEKPVLLMIGGSLGAKRLNEVLRKALPKLLPQFDIIHLCGKGNLDESLLSIAGYKQYEYITTELKDLFAACDIVLSRAGANAICELRAVKKPALLIPLSKANSRGDQILNAYSFEKQGISKVLEEENLTVETLVDELQMLYENRDLYREAMNKESELIGVNVVLGLIDELTQ